MPNPQREDFTVGTVAASAAGRAIIRRAVATGIFHLDGQPSGLALKGGKLACFDFTLHNLLHAAKFADCGLQGHAGADAGDGATGWAGGLEHGDFGTLVE